MWRKRLFLQNVFDFGRGGVRHGVALADEFGDFRGAVQFLLREVGVAVCSRQLSANSNAAMIFDAWTLA